MALAWTMTRMSLASDGKPSGRAVITRGIQIPQTQLLPEHLGKDRTRFLYEWKINAYSTEPSIKLLQVSGYSGRGQEIRASVWRGRRGNERCRTVGRGFRRRTTLASSQQDYDIHWRGRTLLRHGAGLLSKATGISQCHINRFRTIRGPLSRSSNTTVFEEREGTLDVCRRRRPLSWKASSKSLLWTVWSHLGVRQRPHQECGSPKDLKKWKCTLHVGPVQELSRRG